MAFMSWRKDYAVGVAQIDAEHHGLFDLVNEFHDTYAHGDSRRKAAQVLNRLVAYAEEHFQHEEQLMGESGYPLLDQQKELHSELVASIFAINERLAADTARASTEILPFIKNWLVEHIVKNDMDIGEFLRRKNNQAGKALQPASTDKPEKNTLAGVAKPTEQ